MPLADSILVPQRARLVHLVLTPIGRHLKKKEVSQRHPWSRMQRRKYTYPLMWGAFALDAHAEGALQDALGSALRGDDQVVLGVAQVAELLDGRVN